MNIQRQPLDRLRVVVRGAVQGVGFRPFIFRLATELGLKGWVNNSPQGVFIEVEGARPLLETFLLRLDREKPPRSSIQSLEPSWLDAAGFREFEIRASAVAGGKTALILPDIATCPDCLREIFDPQDRRYFYPFTNCTNCGPRFSIIESLPYDRPNTSMKRFTMCPQCEAEYTDPRDRRFHAQPNACPVCGPRLELWDGQGRPVGPNPPLAGAAEAIRAGRIVAVKGLGGFHLMVAAHDEAAVARLRERKHREEKPLAVMFPSLECVKSLCQVSALEERLLRSPEAPIVLLRQLKPEADAPHPRGRAGSPLPAWRAKEGSGGQGLTALTSAAPLAPSLAPGNPNLGAMLPYTPLHHLLFSLLRFPVVATSGNLSDEPICIDEREAVERLAGIADMFLVHNRPIVRHVDDSVARVMGGREVLLRRARGYAPLPVLAGALRADAPPVLAVGAHLKNAIALSKGPQVFVSQHIGDLETDQAHEAFRRVIRDFEMLYEARPAVIAADAHPDYLSSRFAREIAAQDHAVRFVSVQHHLAHVFSCMAENDLQPPVLGVAWDGTGYGLDGTVWGGEFFAVRKAGWARVAHLRQFPLPGGDRAIKEPRRTALGLLHARFGERANELRDTATLNAFSETELATLTAMLRQKLNSPITSSVGRLFDAVSSLAGLRQRVRFEGQAAMELEFALEDFRTDEFYPLPLLPGDPAQLDWAPLLDALLSDLHAAAPARLLSAKFHNALVEAIVAVARQTGFERVALSGGCFQNRYLTERAILRLEREGFRPYWHQRVPPNDGGIALGQVLAATHWRR